MTAKEYLLQLQILDTKINQKLEESAQLRSLVQGRGMSYDSERVQTSPANVQENTIIKYLDIEAKIDRLIDDYVDRKDSIINQIHMIEGTNANKYIQILYYHYVPDETHNVKTLEEIAVIMHYSYDHVCHLHGDALQRFQQVLTGNNI